jgi:hypothetical protein
MGEDVNVNPEAVLSTAGHLEGSAGKVRAHHEAARSRGRVGHGPVGELFQGVVRRAEKVVEDVTEAVAKVYEDSATGLRKVAQQTIEDDAKAKSAFDGLGRRGEAHSGGLMGHPTRAIGIDEERGAGSGFRQSRLYKLSADEIDQLKSDFESIGGDPAILRFNKGTKTGYVDTVDLIYVKGDVYPSTDPSATRSNATLSARAALAHELGHRQFRGTMLEVGDVRDEIRASVWAAKNVTNLSNEERMQLLTDAKDRASGGGHWHAMEQLSAMMRRPVIHWQKHRLDLPWWND